MNSAKPKKIDEYIARFPEHTRMLLEQLRACIQTAAPEAEEKISYAMPTFFLRKNLVHFAAYQHHIGFYPAPSGINKFRKELSSYKTSKGAIQLPIEQPLPLELITKIVQFRVKENLDLP